MSEKEIHYVGSVELVIWGITWAFTFFGVVGILNATVGGTLTHKAGLCSGTWSVTEFCLVPLVGLAVAVILGVIAASLVNHRIKQWMVEHPLRESDGP
jgi:hypothetical protein